jgi:hypothetical protein
MSHIQQILGNSAYDSYLTHSFGNVLNNQLHGKDNEKLVLAWAIKIFSAFHTTQTKDWLSCVHEPATFSPVNAVHTLTSGFINICLYIFPTSKGQVCTSISHMRVTFPVHLIIIISSSYVCKGRPQWPRSLRHELCSPAQTLGSWVWIPFEAYMFAFILCFCGPVYASALR